jgi:hypothetical protein
MKLEINEKEQKFLKSVAGDCATYGTMRAYHQKAGMTIEDLLSLIRKISTAKEMKA